MIRQKNSGYANCAAYQQKILGFLPAEKIFSAGFFVLRGEKTVGDIIAIARFEASWQAYKNKRGYWREFARVLVELVFYSLFGDE